ncbi:MAG: SDR family oxidoreductase [Alphaproteobacteria bacterium]|nr:SDR family oxidoreductase [Alphaproteobacteria bacterium]
MDRPARASRNVAIVTGASRGIGLAVVARFVAAGWRVIGVARSPFPYDAFPWASGMVQHVQADLADPDAIAGLAGTLAATAARDGIGALVNNAGISPKAEGGRRLGVGESDPWLWRSVLGTNLVAPALLARGLAPELGRAGGAIVNITSIVGSRVHPFAGTAYAASKAGLAALTREMAHDFAPRGIRVNAVAPGEIATDILSPRTEEVLLPQIPQRRLGTPAEVAELVYWLCTPAAAYIPGTEIAINGGQHV